MLEARTKLALAALVLSVLLGGNPIAAQKKTLPHPNDCMRPDAKAQERIDRCSAVLKETPLESQARALMFYYRALAYLDINDGDSAIRDLGAAIQLFPEFHHALRQRGQIFLEDGQFEEAVKDFGRVWILQRPTEVWDVLPLAIALREAGLPEAALEQLDRATTLDEDGPDTGPGMAYHYHLGKTLHDLGRYQEAVDVFTAGIPKQPGYFWVYLQRAKSLKAAGDISAARADVQRVFGLLRADPSLIEAMNKSDIEGITQAAMEYGLAMENPTSEVPSIK